jgi:uncharacterized protein YjbI with pentapeptide repeats
MNRLCTVLTLAALLGSWTLPPAAANVFQWEYIDPANPSLGKKQSTTLCVDGAGVTFVPGNSYLYYGKNFAKAWLRGRDLRGVDLQSANLVEAELSAVFRPMGFSSSNLTNASLRNATLIDTVFNSANLTGADFTGATMTAAKFGGTIGFTADQLYSTASYQAKRLGAIHLVNLDVLGWNFAGQDLRNAVFSGTDVRNSDLSGANLAGGDFPASSFAFSNLSGANLTDANFSTYTHAVGANFRGANLTGTNFGSYYTRKLVPTAIIKDADFTDANISGAKFAGDGLGDLTESQLASTANYKARNLADVDLAGNNLAGWSFANQNLTNARFDEATLTGASFVDATIAGASFYRDVQLISFGTGITLEQLYSTASYKARDLRQVNFTSNLLPDAQLQNQNLQQAFLNKADFVNANFERANLTEAYGEEADFTGASFSHASLHGVQFSDATLAGADLSDADLAGAGFARANFAGANLTGARIERTYFGHSVGLSARQFYSTANYQARDLTDVKLPGVTMIGWSFEGQNLTRAWLDYGARLNGANFRDAILREASFFQAVLDGADFTGADARGTFFEFHTSGAIIDNFIRGDGHIAGLALGDGERLLVRDYDGNADAGIAPLPIIVDERFAVEPDASLRFILEADVWDSTIQFAPGISVDFAGTLDLSFAPGTNVAAQVGRTFQLFDWTGVTPRGQFKLAATGRWDVSSLYSTGQATFVSAVPEPSAVSVGVTACFGLLTIRRRTSRSFRVDC